MIQTEVTNELNNKAVLTALMATTFKGLSGDTLKVAIVEGMSRGFTFKDFLEKNIYAVPFGGGYSLITSIDYARKIGMRSGVVGKSAPAYEMSEDGKKVISCTITIKRLVKDTVGEFTETVYFDEYTTGKNQWLQKPRTMIAKVAEIHALRMACPEELSQSYVEEEVEKEALPPEISEEDQIMYTEKLESAKDLKELETIWANLPGLAKKKLEARKDEIKAKLK